MSLAAFIKKNNLKQAELARYLGITEPSVSKAVKGHTNLSKANMQKLLDNDRGWDTSPLTSAPEQDATDGTELAMLRQQVAELRKEWDWLWAMVERLTDPSLGRHPGSPQNTETIDY